MSEQTKVYTVEVRQTIMLDPEEARDVRDRGISLESVLRDRFDLAYLRWKRTMRHFFGEG